MQNKFLKTLLVGACFALGYAAQNQYAAVAATCSGKTPGSCPNGGNCLVIASSGKDGENHTYECSGPGISLPDR